MTDFCQHYTQHSRFVIFFNLGNKSDAVLTQAVIHSLLGLVQFESPLSSVG